MKSLKLFAATLAVAAVPALSWGAGFALFEHGNKALAMGGAFSAVADDPSAIFWNPAGIAGQEAQMMAGVTLIMPTQTFTGSADHAYPGAGYVEEQESQAFFPPHAYIILPINDKLTIGGGTFVPYGLGTWWPEGWAGRFVNKRTDLKLHNINMTFAYQLSDTWSAGLGLNYAAGQLDLTRNVGIINPFTQQIADVTQVHLQTDGLSNTEFGWNVGVLGRFDGGWSVGLTYRSAIDLEVDDANASFTQYATGYPELDAAVAGLLPFDENIPFTSALEFPAYATLGAAWSSDKWTASVQAGWHGWSSFDELALTFPGNPEFNDTIPEDYEDVWQVRTGLEYRTDHHSDFALRGGLLWDESPQPDQSMSPLFVGGDRIGVSVGFGFKLGDHVSVDVADLYLMVDDRQTPGDTHDNFEGFFDSQANLWGITLGYTF